MWKEGRGDGGGILENERKGEIEKGRSVYVCVYMERGGVVKESARNH